MPALRLLGRRWLIAGDDVPLPAAFLATFHLVWMILLALWLAKIDARKDCEHTGSYRAAVSGLIATFALSFIFETAACFVGFRGAPFQTRKRNLLPVLIYLNGLSILAQIGFNAYATALLSSDPPKCSDTASALLNPEDVMKGLVWSTWTVIVGILILMAAAYNLFPDYKNPQEWEDQCNCLSLACCHCSTCCPVSRPSRDQSGSASRRLGSLFSLMFSHIDFAPTDVLVAVGLALAQQHNRKRRLNRMDSSQGQTKRSGQRWDRTISGSESHCLQPPWDKQGHRMSRVKDLYSVDENTRGSLKYGKAQDGPQSVSPTRSISSSNDPCSTGQRSSPRSDDVLLEKKGNFQSSSMRSGTTSLPEGGNVSLPDKSMFTREVSLEPRSDIIDIEEGFPFDSEDSNALRVEPEVLVDAAYFMKFAFAAYGWMLFVWQKKTIGMMRLCCGRSFGMWTSRATRKWKQIGEGLHLQFLNSEAILQAAHITEKDMIFVRFEAQKRNVLPYFIALDHSKKSIVIAIRGSLSLDDVVTDLLFEPSDLDEWLSRDCRREDDYWDLPPPQLRPASRSTKFAAHSGILEAARATLDDIRCVGRLRELLHGQDSTFPEAQDYRLVVCGHSLGAGCAFLVSLYLRKIYPSLKCYAFSPPGGLATRELCAEARGWCTSIVCGKEMVPRLTLATFERLRDELVYCAIFCRMRKLQLFFGWMLGWKWPDRDLFFPPDDLPEEPRKWLEDYRDSIAASVSRRTYVEAAGAFGPPGRVIHLQPMGIERSKPYSYTRSDTTMSSESDVSVASTKVKGIYRQYRAVYVDGNELVEQGVIISGRMMADHMPDFMLALLRKFATASTQQGVSATVLVGDAAGEREMKKRADWELAEAHWKREKEQHRREAALGVEEESV